MRRSFHLPLSQFNYFVPCTLGLGRSWLFIVHLGWSVRQVFDHYSSMLLALFVFPADFDTSQLQMDATPWNQSQVAVSCLDA